MTDARLVKAYGKMAELTAGECAGCPFPHTCCTAEHCAAAIDWARHRYGVELAVTGHPTLPLMGPEGCTAAPHFRPVCTVHTCEIATWGRKHGDTGWTERYFRAPGQDRGNGSRKSGASGADRGPARLAPVSHLHE